MKEIITLFAGIAAGVMFSIPLFMFMLFVHGLDIWSRASQQKINSLKAESEG